MTRTKMSRPKNWPEHVTFLHESIYSKNLSLSQLQNLRTEPVSGAVTTIPVASASASYGSTAATSIVMPPARIQMISSSASHPARGQAGLFACRDLKPGQLIVRYIGELHSSLSAVDSARHADSDYDLWIDREAGIAIDAARAGNLARFINDYRGVAAAPNAEFRDVWDPVKRERGIAIFVLPERKKTKPNPLPKPPKGKETVNQQISVHGSAGKLGIKKGSEILVSYGRSFWTSRQHLADGSIESGAGGKP